MALTVPNLPQIIKADPKLGEALTKTQTYINQNTTAAVGNQVKPPNFVNPSKL